MRRPPEAFWERLQETIEGPEGGYDATSITVAVASLGGELHSEMAGLSESAARILNKEASPGDQSSPPMITLAGLAFARRAVSGVLSWQCGRKINLTLRFWIGTP